MNIYPLFHKYLYPLFNGYLFSFLDGCSGFLIEIFIFLALFIITFYPFKIFYRLFNEKYFIKLKTPSLIGAGILWLFVFIFYFTYYNVDLPIKDVDNSLLKTKYDDMVVKDEDNGYFVYKKLQYELSNYNWQNFDEEGDDSGINIDFASSDYKGLGDINIYDTIAVINFFIENSLFPEKVNKCLSELSSIDKSDGCTNIFIPSRHFEYLSKIKSLSFSKIELKAINEINDIFLKYLDKFGNKIFKARTNNCNDYYCGTYNYIGKDYLSILFAGAYLDFKNGNRVIGLNKLLGFYKMSYNSLYSDFGTNYMFVNINNIEQIFWQLKLLNIKFSFTKEEKKRIINELSQVIDVKMAYEINDKSDIKNVIDGVSKEEFLSFFYDNTPLLFDKNETIKMIKYCLIDPTLNKSEELKKYVSPYRKNYLGRNRFLYLCVPFTVDFDKNIDKKRIEFINSLR